MGEPFLGEIRLLSFAQPPAGWALCNGQLLQINQNQALFSLIGTTYGGDGSSTFALPDLRDRVPMHTGPGFAVGVRTGEKTVKLTIDELPTHTHALNAATSPPHGQPPSPGLLAGVQIYSPPVSQTPLNPAAVSSTGGGEAHPNMQPFLTLSFCIAMQGVYPSPPF